jgi:hypothetical protein
MLRCDRLGWDSNVIQLILKHGALSVCDLVCVARINKRWYSFARSNAAWEQHKQRVLKELPCLAPLFESARGRGEQTHGKTAIVPRMSDKRSKRQQLDEELVKLKQADAEDVIAGVGKKRPRKSQSAEARARRKRIRELEKQKEKAKCREWISPSGTWWVFAKRLLFFYAPSSEWSKRIRSHKDALIIFEAIAWKWKLFPDDSFENVKTRVETHVAKSRRGVSYNYKSWYVTMTTKTAHMTYEYRIVNGVLDPVHGGWRSYDILDFAKSFVRTIHPSYYGY